VEADRIDVFVCKLIILLKDSLEERGVGLRSLCYF